MTDKIIAYLAKKGFQWKRRGDEAVMNCPFCGDKEQKFAVNLATGAWNCLHANKCGKSGSFYELQKEFGDTPEPSKKRERMLKTKKKYQLPKVKMTAPSNPVIDYLRSRGFTDSTIKHFKIGAKGDTTVMIPFYRHEVLTGIKYRDITDKKKMWVESEQEPTLFGRDNITDNRLIICEGEYDAMAMYQYGINAVSVPMGVNGLDWIETEWDYLDTFPEICLCMDQDAAGQEAARKIASRLGEWRCRLVELPKKDANECLKAKVSVQEMQRCIDNATDMKPETLVTPDFFRAKVHDLFRKGTALMGTPTPWKKLTSILKGWRGGELTVWSGKNGSGKSTVLNQVFIDLATKDTKTCIYSGEMPPERYLRWAIIQIHGNDAPAPHAIESTIDLLSYYIHILNITGGIDPDKLLDDFEYAARRYNVKHFIIDSLMKINFQQQDEYRQQQEFVSRLCGFAQKFDAHVHLVAHPRKTMTDEDEPGKVDVKGTSHITDLAHNVIVLNRATEKLKEKAAQKNKTCADMKLFVKKNREFGIEGCVNMMFNEQAKRFSDGSEEEE